MLYEICSNLYSIENSLNTSSRDFPVYNTLVSSANNINRNLLEILARSFMYTINRIGPNIDPCGIPHNIDFKLDLVSLNITYCLPVI